jgi:radical SAM protein with 4Fe4S-binding SPASM domain
MISGINFYPSVVHIPDNINFIVEDEDKWIETYKKYESQVNITENSFHIGRPSEKIQRATNWGISLPVCSRANTVDSQIIDPFPYKKGKIRCDNHEAGEVLPNGDVVLCCMDYGLKHKLGNLLVNSYEDILNSEEFKKVKLSMDDDNIESICRYCYKAVAND